MNIFVVDTDNMLLNKTKKLLRFFVKDEIHIILK